MSEPIADLRRFPRLRLLPAEVRCAAERIHPRLPHTLAFWALWHCRHARPPDALRTAL
jgi:hypothetical protein